MLLDSPPSVVNVGLASFAQPIVAAGGAVTQVSWSPPGSDPAVARAVARLAARTEVAEANQQALAAFLAAEPVLEGIGRAGDSVPNFGERTLLHAGPPIDWRRMGGALRGAVIGAILLEGWASDAPAAQRMAANGEIRFDPCHHHGAVGPMAGVICPSMPVWVVRNRTHGNCAFSTLNEGLGKVLRYGANSPEVLARLRWMEATLAPALTRALADIGPIEMKPLIARALHMGDELHNRNAAASALLFKRLAPGLLRAGVAPGDAAAALEFINGNDHFFLNLGMATCKAMLDSAAGVPGSSMVVAMARNGTEFGIRVSGCGARWFTAPASVADGLFFPGYARADAGGDIGDSAITETAGLGGFAMAAAPAVVQFVGGAAADALRNTVTMRHITIGTNRAFTLPALEFAGAPAGIDACQVVDTGLPPVINTGIAHREAGVGQIGAGITYAPLACFNQAVVALAERLGTTDEH
jgi:hypothetical protein